MFKLLVMPSLQMNEKLIIKKKFISEENENVRMMKFHKVKKIYPLKLHLSHVFLSVKLYS